MTQVDLQARRAKIVRRWTAYRISLAQRAIWKTRRSRAGHDIDDDASGSPDHDLLAELPDSLLG